MKHILVVLLVIAGSGLGFIFFSSDVAPADAEDMVVEGLSEGAVDFETIELGRQFIFPIVHEERTQGLIMIDLILEAPPGSRDNVSRNIPRVRDAIIQEMTEFSAQGLFDMMFTNRNAIEFLQKRLSNTVSKRINMPVSVLIQDIMRQDLH